MFRIMEAKRDCITDSCIDFYQINVDSLKNNTSFLLWNSANFIGSFFVDEDDSVFLNIHANRFGINSSRTSALRYTKQKVVKLLTEESLDTEIERIKKLIVQADNVVDVIVLNLSCDFDKNEILVDEFFEENKRYNCYEIRFPDSNGYFYYSIYYALESIVEYTSLNEIMQAVVRGKTEFYYSVKNFDCKKDIDYETITKLLQDKMINGVAYISYKGKYYTVKHVCDERTEEEQLSWKYCICVTEIPVIEVK